MAQPAERLNFLDYAKGMAIILVVAGHYHPAASPDIWHLLRAFIYKFHMPVFFFVSGFLFFREIQKTQTFSLIIKKKILRLGLPFMSIALLFGTIKILAGFFVNLDNAVSFSSILNVFICPLDSYIPQLWFLQSIFTIFFVYSFLHIVLKLNHWLILILSIAFSFVNITDYFTINSTLKSFNYFCFGIIMAKLSLYERINSYSALMVGLALVALALLVFVNGGDSTLAVRTTSYFGMFGLVGLALFLGKAKLSSVSWIETVGFYSMSIYLFHTLFESTVRIAYYQILKLPDAYFWGGFFVAVSAGVICSLFVEKLFLRKFKLTRKFILGLPK